jgi:hypothetical protein
MGNVIQFRARRAADKPSQDHDSQPEVQRDSFTCTPASIVLEHLVDMAACGVAL